MSAWIQLAAALGQQRLHVDAQQAVNDSRAPPWRLASFACVGARDWADPCRTRPSDRHESRIVRPHWASRARTHDCTQRNFINRRPGGISPGAFPCRDRSAAALDQTSP